MEESGGEDVMCLDLPVKKKCAYNVCVYGVASVGWEQGATDSRGGGTGLLPGPPVLLWQCFMLA